MGRAPCCDKATVRKGPWSPEEDAALKSYIDEQGPVGNWIALPQKIGLNRCGKSCRLRWLNYLRPNIKHGGFSEEEDNFICSLYIAIGSRWSIIAAQLPGRTDNDIKNYWNTKLKKKLLGKQHNKEHHARRNNPKSDGMKKPSTKNENLSVVSGTANGWSEVPQEVVSHLPPASMSRNPNYPIGSLASIQELLVQIGGRFSPNQEEELVPINPYNLHCPSGLISPTYYPVERSTIVASSRPFNDISFEGPPTTQYSTSKVDNVPVVFDDMLPDFSTGTEMYGQHIENIYGALETLNGSLCSSAASNPEGSSIIWEADTSSFLDGNNSQRPPLPCEIEAQSRSLGGGIGTGDIIHLWRNRGCLWDTVNGILCDQPK